MGTKKVKTTMVVSHFDINDRMKLIRLTKKMTQKQFAESLGLTIPYIKAIESYKYTPSITVLKLLHTKFSLSYDWLIDGTVQKTLATLAS